MEQKDQRGQAMVLNSLGGVLQRLGRIQEADQAFEWSIGIGTSLNDTLHLAKVRTAYGKALLSRGEMALGVEQLRQGFLLDEHAHNGRGISIVAPILIDTLRRQGAHAEAEGFVNRALKIAGDHRAIQRLVTPESLPEPAIPSSIRVCGRIKRLLEPLGRTRFGFIRNDGDGPDIYFSERRVGTTIFSTLSPNALVEAEVITTPRGQEAIAIRLLEDGKA